MEFTIQRGLNVPLGGLITRMVYPDIDKSDLIKERDINRIAEWGFDHIRFPVDAEYLITEDAPQKIIEEHWAILDKYAGWATKCGLSVILALNSTYGHNSHSKFENFAAKHLFTMDLHRVAEKAESIDMSSDDQTLFSDNMQQDIFINFWKFASGHYSNAENIAFELLNNIDASIMSGWNELARKAVQEIRKTSPGRVILYSGLINETTENIGASDVIEDSNIIFPFQFYKPWLLTHEMDTYSKTSMDYYTTYLGYPINYPGRIRGIRKFIERFPEHKPLEIYDEKFIDYQFIKQVEFAPISAFIKKYPGKKIYCSEFGMTANVGEPNASNWIRDVKRLFNEMAIPNAFFAYLSPGFSIADAYRYDMFKSHWVDLLMDRENGEE